MHSLAQRTRRHRSFEPELRRIFALGSAAPVFVPSMQEVEVQGGIELAVVEGTPDVGVLFEIERLIEIEDARTDRSEQFLRLFLRDAMPAREFLQAYRFVSHGPPYPALRSRSNRAR